MSTSLITVLAIYSVAICASSLFGGWLPTRIRLTHTRIQSLISFVGGLMLGIAVFHLLPHAVHELGSDRVNEIAWTMMIGMIIMFFMLRFFHFHQHEPIDLPPAVRAASPVHDSSLASRPMNLPTIERDATAVAAHTHDHHCDHPGHDHLHNHDHHHHAHALSWFGVLIGLGFHTLLDGVALASTMQVDAEHSFPGETSWWGIGVFLAIVLHKPLDAMSITSLMRAEGMSNGKCAIVNILFSAMVPVGALIVFLFGSAGGPWAQSIAGWGLAFSAGVFLCISLSDLLPEMEFHSHNRVQLSIALLLGILAAWGIGFLEPEHLHHDHPAGENVPTHIHLHSR